jgi:hypothetical protein
MKEYFSCGFSRDGDPRYGGALPGDIFDDLTIIFPEGIIRPDCFLIELETGSEDLRRLLSFLQHYATLRPSLTGVEIGGHLKNRTFSVQGRRVFTSADIDESPFCMLRAPKNMGESSYQEDGTPTCERRDLKSQPIGRGSQNEIFCSDAMMRQIQRENFEGAEFRKVVVTGRGLPKRNEPIWQPWSGYELPSMLNERLDLDACPLTFEDDSSRGCYLKDIFYPPLIKYPKGVLAEIEGFDLLRSRERFGASSDKTRRVPFLFVSTKLRKWFESAKIGVEFSPVQFA